MTVLVIGASGNIGSQLVKQLDAKGQKVRALVRDAKKSPKGADAAVGDLSKPDTLDNAMKGVDGVFCVVSGSPDMAKLEKNAIDAAKKNGVKHFVLLSVAGADKGSPIKLAQWHAESETNLKNSGLNHTILQPTMFMQNTLGNLGSIKGEGKVYFATKNGRLPLVDAVDIAATAASILASPSSHNGKTYYLTGPEALTQTQMCEKISKVAGKTVTYVDIPSSALAANMQKMGVPEWMAKDFATMNDFFATDGGAQTSPDVENVTGRKPRTFDAFLADNAAAFK
jgi:uncharacterized protein YbjT (DUF2867 family)